MENTLNCCSEVGCFCENVCELEVCEEDDCDC